jgi:polygalacturonase
MAVSRVKTWSDEDILTHTALNAEYDNITNAAGGDMVTPATKNWDMAGWRLIDADILATITGGAASTTDRNIETRLGEIVNVKDYGALGDGSTDDATAINAAITAAEAATYGATVFFPPGRYICNAAIALSSGKIRLIGSGIGVTELYRKSATANTHVLTLTGTTDVEVAYMTLNGSRLLQTTSGHCLRGDSITRTWIHHIRCTGAYTYGMGFENGTIDGLWIESCIVDDTGDDGIDFKNSDDDNRDIVISNIVISQPDRLASGANAGIDIRGPAMLSNIVVRGLDSTNEGIRFRQNTGATDGGQMSSLTNFHVTGTDITDVGVGIYAPNVAVSNGYVLDCNTGVNIDIQSGEGDADVTVTGVTAESCSDGFHIKTNTVGAKLIGCTTIDATSRGIRVAGATDTKIQSCRTENSTTTGIFLLSNPRGTRIFDCDLTSNATAITISAGSVDTLIDRCRFYANSANISDSGRSTIIKNNFGGVSDNPSFLAHEGSGLFHEGVSLEG